MEQIIKQKLLEHLNLAHLVVEGDGSHFGVIAVSDDFANLTKIKQQQMIYAPLNEYFASGEIHALSIKTFTTEQWKKEKFFH